MSITKSELLAGLSDMTSLDKRTVDTVLVALAEIIKFELGPDGQGDINIPGIVSLKAKDKPARATRVGKNPFTRQTMVFHSKPATKTIKSRPLKALKDLFGR